LSIKDNDLLVVVKGKKEILVPFAKPICLKIDLKRKEILVDLPEGLLELDEI
jgi:ribosomal 30S subunit maturation factor RimM